MNYVIGVDPGIHGAVAVLTQDGKLVAEKRYSYDPRIEVYAHEVCQ